MTVHLDLTMGIGDTSLGVPMQALYPVLDKGYVAYMDHLGNDRRVTEAARVSYGGKSKGDEADKKLLFYLYKNRHTSPFEQCSITFNIKMPIFVARQFVRHRTFSLNEISARYTEMKEEFYIPVKWRDQDTVNKQGSIERSESKINLTGQAQLAYDMAMSCYRNLLDSGVAKEMARMVLPVGLYTEVTVNCDLHNLMHFIRLRDDSHAQWEMQQYAKAMRKIAEDLFPWSMEAFNKFKMKVVEE